MKLTIHTLQQTHTIEHSSLLIPPSNVDIQALASFCLLDQKHFFNMLLIAALDVLLTLDLPDVQQYIQKHDLQDEYTPDIAVLAPQVIAAIQQRALRLPTHEIVIGISITLPEDDGWYINPILETHSIH